MGDIQYNYPIEKLDQLVEMIYDQGMTPMMTPDLKAEVELRYQELIHAVDDDGEDDETFLAAKEQHAAAMKRIDEERRKSHSRNVMILDLTDEEAAELEDGISMSYIRSDPNSSYNLSDDDIASDETRRRLYKQLRTLGKVYYHQADYRNAINIIMEAIEYSLRNDYPWLSYDEAVKQFNEGKIRYTFAQIPLLYIDYNTPISDPKILAGIVSGEVNLIDKDTEPVKKKKQKSKPVSFRYDVIGKSDHDEMVKVHQAGYNTDISTILKSCSTIYNRYVVPTSFTWDTDVSKNLPDEIDWMRPGAGHSYYDLKYGKKTNPTTEIVGLLNEQNDRKLNHVIGNSMRDFAAAWNYGRSDVQRSQLISTSLEHHDEAVAIENRLMDLIRQSNPNV